LGEGGLDAPLFRKRARLTSAPILRAGPDPDLTRLPVGLDFTAVSLAEGVRAALAVAVLVALNEWAAVPDLTEAALGALLTCLCDPGGPIRRRVPALLTFLVLGSAATAAFGLLRNAGVLPAAIAGSAWILCTMFARAWGPTPMQVGNLLTVVAVLALDRHVGGWAHALEVGAMFGAGSFWALALAVLIWRVHPYGPARRATAEVYRRLATLAADLSELLAQGGARPDWAAHARAHRRYVRDGIEAARAEVLEVIRGRGQGSARGNALLIQAEAADQLFGALIALSDLLEHGDADARQAARPVLPALRLLLAAIADAITLEQPVAERGMIERLLAEIARGRDSAALAGVTEALGERLRIAALMTTPEGETVEGVEPRDREKLARRLIAPLRANLGWDSAALRHAIRAGAVALPALVITLSAGVAYAHWLTITLVLTLQPFFALTWQRAVERVGGTVLGGIAAAALAAFVHTPVAMAAALFPLAVAAFAVRRVSFGLFTAALTPLIVLLSELGQPGSSEFAIAAWRAGFTVAGGAMAVLGGDLLWPSWEPARVRARLQDAISAHAEYADAELAALLGEGTSEAAEAARRQAGVANNNFETTLSRALQEPHSATRVDLRPAMLADAALRRVAGRLSALQYQPNLPQEVDLFAWRAWLQRAFAALHAETKLPSAPPPDAPAGSLARIARQLGLIEGALRRANAAQPATPPHPPPP